MGLKFRKSIKIGPARVNISKSGIGASVGVKGLRVTKKAGGGTRTTASIPGTGISYVKDSSSKKKASSAPTKKSTPVKQSTPTTSSSKPVKKTWFTAIVLAIIGFFVVGIISLIVAFITGLIIELFTPISDAFARIWMFGIPIALGGLTAFFAIRSYKPEKISDATPSDETITE